MPHIRLEYSRTLDNLINIQDMVQTAHDALVEQGIPAKQTKSRAIPLDHLIAGDLGPQGLMVHISLHLLTGRDVDLRNQYGRAIYNAVNDVLESINQPYKLTLDVIEMCRETYLA